MTRPARLPLAGERRAGFATSCAPPATPEIPNVCSPFARLNPAKSVDRAGGNP